MVHNLDSKREAPTYNIKAVARLTGVPADTLRRWESRYGVIAPERTESGYRLYSQRHIDTILWLKAKLDEGLSISRACEMLRQMGGDPGKQASNGNDAASSTPPFPAGYSPLDVPAQVTTTRVRSFDALKVELFDAFKNVDEERAGKIISEALSLYSIEEVCIQIITNVLVQIGEAWLTGEISVAVEHFASSFVRARLENFYHASPYNLQGPFALVACAPEELHELGAMFLSVFLRRAGFRVVYLGQNVPLDSLMGMITALKLDVVCVSSTRAETASALYSLRDFLDDMAEKRGKAPLLAYGGRVFNRFPHITERLGGLYLGEDAPVAVRRLTEELRKRGAEGITLNA